MVSFFSSVSYSNNKLKSRQQEHLLFVLFTAHESVCAFKLAVSTWKNTSIPCEFTVTYPECRKRGTASKQKYPGIWMGRNNKLQSLLKKLKSTNKPTDICAGHEFPDVILLFSVRIFDAYRLHHDLNYWSIWGVEFFKMPDTAVFFWECLLATLVFTHTCLWRLEDNCLLFFSLPLRLLKTELYPKIQTWDYFWCHSVMCDSGVLFVFLVYNCAHGYSVVSRSAHLVRICSA